MSTVNAATGYSPFQLRFGFSPRLIPPLLGMPPDSTPEQLNAFDIIRNMELITADAQDNLTAAKIDQAHYANRDRLSDIPIKIGDHVMLSTDNFRRQYRSKTDKRANKLMPRFSGPWRVLAANAESSTYTLDLPAHMNVHPTFHISNLKLFHPNDDENYPDRAFEEPGPVLTEDGQLEHVIDRIIDQRRRGRGMQYLVHWRGYPDSHDEWIAGSLLQDNAALDVWEQEHSSSSQPQANGSFPQSGFDAPVSNFICGLT